VTPVRPTSTPQTPTVSPQADAARAAAQRAFFQAALGGPAPQATAAPAATTTTPTVFAQPVQRLPDPAAPPPNRILRPGSLLDIKV